MEMRENFLDRIKEYDDSIEWDGIIFLEDGSTVLPKGMTPRLFSKNMDKISNFCPVFTKKLRGCSKETEKALEKYRKFMEPQDIERANQRIEFLGGLQKAIAETRIGRELEAGKEPIVAFDNLKTLAKVIKHSKGTEDARILVKVTLFI